MSRLSWSLAYWSSWRGFHTGNPRYISWNRQWGSCPNYGTHCFYYLQGASAASLRSNNWHRKTARPSSLSSPSSRSYSRPSNRSRTRTAYSTTTGGLSTGCAARASGHRGWRRLSSRWAGAPPTATALWGTRCLSLWFSARASPSSRPLYATTPYLGWAVNCSCAGDHSHAHGSYHGSSHLNGCGNPGFCRYLSGARCRSNSTLVSPR